MWLPWQLLLPLPSRCSPASTNGWTASHVAEPAQLEGGTPKKRVVLLLIGSLTADALKSGGSNGDGHGAADRRSRGISTGLLGEDGDRTGLDRGQ